MSLFEVIPWMRRKKDGSKEQIMPQTSIKAVIGLSKRLKTIETAVEKITGRNIDNTGALKFLTKKDLENYATKDDLKTTLENAKKYTDLVTTKVVTLTNGANVDSLTTNGIFYKPKNITVNGLPPYNTINQSGILFVINGSDGRLLHKWISMDITVYEYERIPNYPLTNPIKWGSWNYKS